MKILMVTESFRTGGKERRLYELLKGFTKIPEITCEVIMLKDLIEYTDYHNLKITTHILERKIKKDPRVLLKIQKIIRQFQPDIIHTWGGMASVYGIPLAKMMKIFTINGMITNSSPLKIFSENWNRSRLTFPFSDIILANSYAGIKAYKANEKKARVIYNGFDFQRTGNLENEKQVRRKFGIETPFVVGMVAAIHPRKDYVSYIEAAQQVLNERNDVTFLIVGDGAGKQELEAMVNDQYREHIKFLGRQKDVESIVNCFTIGVLTTNKSIHGEGISNSIMEYMALGKPVIATHGGGTPEIVSDDETGYLIKEKDSSTLTKKLLFLLNHPEKIKTMGEKANARIKQDFSIESMISSTLRLYKERYHKKKGDRS